MQYEFLEDDDLNSCLSEELFDENWILEAEKEEESYSRFYKIPVEKITCFSLFMDSSKNLIKLNRQFINTNKDGLITQTDIINIINNDSNSNRFRIEHLLCFNLDINPNDIQSFIFENDNQKLKNLYLKEISYTNDIKFNDTIKYLQPINSLIFIYKQKKSNNKMNQNIKINKTKKQLFDIKLSLKNNKKTRKH